MNTINQLSQVYRFILLLLIAVPASYSTAAEKPIPPWMHKDVLQAALNIGMNAEQSPHFKVALSRYFDDLNLGIKKLIRRNPTGLDREIKRKRNSVRKRMDKDMAKFLDEGQMSKYFIYRDLLLGKMGNPAKGSSPAVLQDAPTSHTY